MATAIAAVDTLALHAGGGRPLAADKIASLSDALDEIAGFGRIPHDLRVLRTAILHQ